MSTAKPGGAPVYAARRPAETHLFSQPGRASATKGQLMALGARLRGQGVSVRPERLRLVSAMVGRELGSMKELTEDEAAAVLDRLAEIV